MLYSLITELKNFDSVYIVYLPNGVHGLPNKVPPTFKPHLYYILIRPVAIVRAGNSVPNCWWQKHLLEVTVTLLSG